MLLLAGCGPAAPKVRYLPERIASVAVPTFGNQTVVPGLEEKLTTRTIEEYLRDGRVRVLPASPADAVLTGLVTKYTLEPLSYQASGANAGAVSEYSLRIRVDVALRERANGQDLWTVRDLEEETRYGTESGFVSTEDQARQRVLEYLARAAVKQTFEGTYTRK